MSPLDNNESFMRLIVLEKDICRIRRIAAMIQGLVVVSALEILFVN